MRDCSGEHEPDCQPEERQQQWYDWEGHDRGTFICKRNALLPVALLRNVSAKTLISKTWSELLPVLLPTFEVNVSKKQLGLRVLGPKIVPFLGLGRRDYEARGHCQRGSAPVCEI